MCCALRRLRPPRTYQPEDGAVLKYRNCFLLTELRNHCIASESNGGGSTTPIVSEVLCSKAQQAICSDGRVVYEMLFMYCILGLPTGFGTGLGDHVSKYPLSAVNLQIPHDSPIVRNDT